MNYDFTFSKIPQIIFGKGKLNKLLELPILLSSSQALLVTGSRSFTESEKYTNILEAFAKKSIQVHVITVKGEPSPELVDGCVRQYKDKGIDVVISIGGGSVIDAGKAISAMLLQEEAVMAYLEGVGEGKRHDGRKVPFIAIPTTAGTGSEVTKNAVLSRVGRDGFKNSLRHDSFVPDMAILDPELTVTCPKTVTAASGMDALCQLIGSYMSTQASPMTDALALSGIKAAKESLLELCTRTPNDIENRSKMLYAAFASGITLANAGLGIVHGYASSLGGRFDIPHGVICGCLLAECVEMNIRILLDREERKLISKPIIENTKIAQTGGIIFIKKYAYLGLLFTEAINEIEEIEELDGLREACFKLVNYLKGLTEALKIPKLGQYGVCEQELIDIAKATDEKNNPVKLSIEQKVQILRNRI